ncbi:MAG: hypothetical protein ABSG78_05480 [Verrucomicrobiota bacterium]|jgi:hypothetical protein
MEIAELRDKLKAELAVVEKFFEIAKARGANGSVTKSATGVDIPRPAAQPNLRMPGLERKYGALAETVQEAIKLAPDKYTIADLFEILGKIGKPLEKGQIGTVLNRLSNRENSPIQVHRRGKGSRATIFKKVSETKV